MEGQSGKLKYILIDVDYDENVTEKKEFSEEGLYLEFLGNEETLQELINCGVYEWEWGVFHLINTEDYK